MAASSGSEAPQRENEPPLAQRSRAARRRRAGHRDGERRPGDEPGFWAGLEERDFGRLALETDHLFDTSYNWAA